MLYIKHETKSIDKKAARKTGQGLQNKGILPELAARDAKHPGCGKGF